MQISFVRVRGQRDRIYVHRADGSEVSWVFPTYGDMLPHDLVHAVVEDAFGIRDGLWGRVDGGMDPKSANDPNLGANREAFVRAEAIVNQRWLSEETDDEIAEKLAALDQKATPEAVRTIRERLRALTIEWTSIESKGTLELVCFG